MPRVRILIYARGTEVEIEEQHNQSLALAARHGYDVVSIASDPPGASDGWVSARHMLYSGEVDRILVATHQIIPHYSQVESVTQEVRRPRHDGASHRRPRRLPRE